MPDIRKMLEQRIAAGNDTALARFTLGRMALDEKRPDEAVTHLLQAIDLDAGYSAAYALLGKAQARLGDIAAAKKTYERGADIAEERGDLQAARQMRALLAKLDK